MGFKIFALSISVLLSCILIEKFATGAAIVVEPVVTIGQGKLKGKVEVSRNGKEFAQFLNIPYSAKPERFQEAGPAEKWDGIRDATKFGSPCSQFDRKSKTVIGSEDCLVLNVFSPEIPSPNNSTVNIKAQNNKRPVIVFIHGGSFVSQNGEIYGPKYLIDQNLILVTFNYRVSVFGFLSTGDSAAVANLGLRDQIQALKWVHLNIAAFGGDATRVTLAGGSSAGGAMSSYLMMSPLAKGLFSSVISTSGNAICPWAVVHNPRKVAEKLASKLNCPPTAKSSKEIVACIKGKSVKDIEIARVSLQGFSEDPAIPFAPVVESWLTSSGTTLAVIPDAPEKLMSEGNYNRVPWLTGVNSLNGINLGIATILTTPKRLTQLDQEWDKLAPLLFHYSQTSPHPLNVSNAIRAHYFGKNISLETAGKLESSLTDRNFIHCTAKAASIQSKFSPVYLYYLEYVGGYGFLDEWALRDKLNVSGVVHGDELQHIFNLKLGNFPLIKKGDKHFPFSDKMVKLWTSFAETWKPMDMTEKAGAEWSPIPSGTSKHEVEWHKLDSTAFSRPIILDGEVQSTLWDEVGLGYKMTSTTSGSQKFAIGYEMSKNSPKPSPISKVIPTEVSSTPKTSSSQVTTTRTTLKPLDQDINPFVGGGGGVLKDDDPYSSTTTSTTKKPGFLQKLVG